MTCAGERVIVGEDVWFLLQAHHYQTDDVSNRKHLVLVTSIATCVIARAMCLLTFRWRVADVSSMSQYAIVECAATEATSRVSLPGLVVIVDHVTKP